MNTKIDGITAQREWINELKKAHSTLLAGPYEWGSYNGPDTNEEYLSKALKQGIAGEKVWFVSIPETDPEYLDQGVDHITIAITGNGANSKNHARAIAHLLNNSAALIELAESHINDGEVELTVDEKWRSFARNEA